MTDNIAPFPRPQLGLGSAQAHRVTCQRPGCDEYFLTADGQRADFMASRWLCRLHDGNPRPPAPMITAVADTLIANQRAIFEANEAARQRQENQR